MKIKNLKVLFILGFIIMCSVVVSAKSASATNGGPTIIDRISFKASENSLYYVVNDGGGRGCPPEITKLNLTTNAKSIVVPCEKIESTYRVNGVYSYAAYEQFILTTFQSFTSLLTIDFVKNDITVGIKYVGVHKYGEADTASDFKATISQAGKAKGEIDFIGCNKDQTNVFRGYGVPNTDKMVLVVSRIGNCFEGGYVEDSLVVVDGITFKDTGTPTYNSYVGPQVRLGDLALTAREVGPGTISTSPTDSQETKKTSFSQLWMIFTFLIGLLGGYMIKQKTTKVQAPAPIIQP